MRAWTASALPTVAGEAYYWLWSRHLATGYFDHPPMTAWMGMLFCSWGAAGNTLAVRFDAIILMALSSLALFFLARELFPRSPRAPWTAVLLYNMVPLFNLNGMFHSPDGPLALFCILTWLTFWRAAQNGRPTQWLATGVCAGLALLCKFHAWVLLPPLYLFLLFSPRHRTRLASPWPWIAIVVALLILSPNLIWNAQNDWMNYAFQWRRSDIPESRFEWGNIIDFIVPPIFVLTPLIWWAMLAAVWRILGNLMRRREIDSAYLFLMFAGLPLPLFLALLTPFVTISAHWPAPAYPALLLLAVGLMEADRLHGARFRKSMIALCVALLLFAHATPLLIEHIPSGMGYGGHIKLANTDRVRRKVLGWDALGDKVRHEHAALVAEHPGTPTIVMAKSWHLASQIAFYSGLHNDCFVFEAGGSHNFTIWLAERDWLPGANAIIVIEKTKPNKHHRTMTRKYDKYIAKLAPIFERVERAPSLVVYNDGRIDDNFLSTDVSEPKLREFLFLRAYGFKGRLLED